MRYLTVLIVCGLFFLGVQGCGRGEPERPEVGEPARKLTLWHILNYSGPREVIEAAVARFEAAHPGVDVEVQTFDNDPYKTKLAIEMEAARLPTSASPGAAATWPSRLPGAGSWISRPLSRKRRPGTGSCRRPWTCARSRTVCSPRPWTLPMS
jgi:hypothetical protein